MRLPNARRFGRRARLLAMACALASAAAAALLAPPLALAPLGAAAAIVLWDRVALERELRALAAAVLTDGPDAKLEVTDDAWGELCHAVNRLRQQRRAQRQVEPMLPALPVARAARLADAGIPPEGLLCEVAVLALTPSSALGSRLDQLRESARTALHYAQAHDALMARSGDQLLLIFGALGTQSPATALRAARDAARDLHRLCAGDGGACPSLSLAAGTARALILPGLGLSVLGAPIEQALGLQSHAGPTLLLCNEDAYLGLRRIGAVPAQPAAPRLATADNRPVYAISL